MNKFDRKPQTVEAERFVGGADSAKSIGDFVSSFGASANWEVSTEDGYHETLTITTMQGKLLLVPGDWFVRDELNQFSGMPDDAFTYTYETEDTDV